ncbi:hypothetical protein QLQ12_00475 [Actinoplanes sp. NEAU-A12]|uniref:Uncharacterized protein n=1 Tax=Actinoplanes sandaracinus TaxID=3045177 RepID=A0ABT6WBK4_9ACTN|nr:hypothetical protein [Actinoplanes sandaracinus]MDI6097082.1 hypothetical protein [Actinoplanes sandaracinus]
MIAVVRSELYRGVTILSSWLALIGFSFLAALFGWFSEDVWSLFAGVGAFGIAVTVISQHYQHRTSLLLFLAKPHRWRVLVAQCLVTALMGTLLVAISGVAVLLEGDVVQYRSTVLVAPVMSVFGVLCTTVVRRPLWLVAGALGWLLLAEGIINRGAIGLPFASFMLAAGGSMKGLLVLLAWTAAVLPVALWSVRKDLTGD